MLHFFHTSCIDSFSKFHCLYLQGTSQVFLHLPTSTHSSLVQAAFISDLGACSSFLPDLLVCPDSVELGSQCSNQWLLVSTRIKAQTLTMANETLQDPVLSYCSSLPRLFLGLTASAALDSVLTKQGIYLFLLFIVYVSTLKGKLYPEKRLLSSLFTEKSPEPTIMFNTVGAQHIFVK